MDENKKAYYAVIPANVRYDKTLKPNAKLLYGEISALANEKGFCWANNNYFAELYDVGTETISRWVSDLFKRGYVQVEILAEEGNQRRIWLSQKAIPIDEKSNTSCANEQRPLAQKGKHNNTYNNTINKYMYTQDFEEFYSIYPNKFNKEQTFKNWESALKKDSKENIMLATRNYVKYIADNNTSKQYVVRSTNFLGQKQEYKGYLDYMHLEQDVKIPKVANAGSRKILE